MLLLSQFLGVFFTVSVLEWSKQDMEECCCCHHRIGGAIYFLIQSSMTINIFFILSFPGIFSFMIVVGVKSGRGKGEASEVLTAKSHPMT